MMLTAPSRLLYLLVGAFCLLLLAFLANWLQTGDVHWTASDFLVAAFLALAFVACLESILRMPASTKSRLIIAACMATLFAFLWIELAIGIFD